MFSKLTSGFAQMWSPKQENNFNVSPELDKPWRSVTWSDIERDRLLKSLNDFQPGNPKVSNIKILLYGPVGAGKSSFFNSVNSSLLGRITSRASADATSGKSFTMTCQSFKLKKGTTGSFFPFMITDIRGIEQEEGKGVHHKDIGKLLQGHIKDGYKFNSENPITYEDPKYNESPSLHHRIHCVVAVLPASLISLLEQDIIAQMRKVREKARDMGVPQVIIMTRVDEACPLVKENLEKVYTSKKIKEKMQECSNRLGVPVNCIFPVKNYHEEDNTNTTMDILILKAIQHVLNFANDYVEDQEENE